MSSRTPVISVREQAREQRFREIWARELDSVFADVAPYYDRANQFASLGMWNRFLNAFMSMVELQPHQRVLDVCAGTNAIGIALLEREPTLAVTAMDRSPGMQQVGQQRARARSMHIDSVIGDVHTLPFPDASFDIVTLQYASRHLRVRHAFAEIQRVLKPGGGFYHCDMLRPANPVLESLYYAYLRACLAATGFFFRSGRAALECKRYFIHALEMFYSAEELSALLRELGYQDVRSKSLLGGMIGAHRATRVQSSRSRPVPAVRDGLRSAAGARKTAHSRSS